MSTKSDFTLEEWAAMPIAPYLAGMLIIVSDLSLGFISEIGA